MEWNKPVPFDEMPNIEKQQMMSIFLILNIEQLPILQTTPSMHNSLMYKHSDVNYDKQIWLLRDDDHHHATINDNDVLSISYLCHE